MLSLKDLKDFCEKQDCGQCALCGIMGMETNPKNWDLETVEKYVSGEMTEEELEKFMNEI